LSFLAALRFLTILPISRRRAVPPQELARSTGYFPLVGIIIGLILAGSYWLLQFILPLSVITALLLVGMAVLSGGLHLDGFVDTFTFDGIGGHKTVEARWQVMHDSRAGAFGIVSVFFLLLVKYFSLASVPQTVIMPTLVLMPVLSRWAMVYALSAYPYAKASGLGTAFKEGVNWRRFLVATSIALAVVIPFFRLAGLVIMLGVWLITLAMAFYLRRKFSGLTGDTYGAINEVTEVTVLIMVCLLTHNQWLGLI